MRLIQGGKIEPQTNKPKMVCCAVCNGTTFIEAVVGAYYVSDVIEGGDKQLLCAQCLAEGRVESI